MGNLDKEKQLGMSVGTANHILTRSLLFALSQRLGLDKCHRCGLQIMSAEELSKDHVVDWLHSERPKELFFSVSNIAFSHKRCNRPSRKVKKNLLPKSKFRGVYRQDRMKSKPWSVRIKVAGKQRYVGFFATELEAAIAHDKAVITANGELAVTNKSLGLI